MFPIQNKYTIGYRFGQKTTYSSHHLGLDCICPKNTPVFAPFNGKVTTIIGTEGGNTVWFYWGSLIMRIMHLNSFAKKGQVDEGDIIGYVGSTGSLSSGNHAHIDISKVSVQIDNFNNFIDPETFNWGESSSMKPTAEWYSINGSVFHNNTYVGDPAAVPWANTLEVNPQGYVLIPGSDLAGLMNQIEGLNKQIKSTATALGTCEVQRDKNQQDLAELLGKSSFLEKEVADLDEENEKLIKKADEAKKEFDEKIKKLDDTLKTCKEKNADNPMKPSWFDKWIQDIRDFIKKFK